MERISALVLVLAALGARMLAAADTVLGPTGVVLERLYNTSTQLPGTTTPISLASIPVPCGDGVVFQAREFNATKSWGYRVTSTSLEVFVDEESIIPGTSEVFFELSDVGCIADGEYSFLGSGDPASGLRSSAYRWSPGGHITLIQAGGVAVDDRDVGPWIELHVSENRTALVGNSVPGVLGEMIALKPAGRDAIFVADETQVLPGQTEPASNFGLRWDASSGSGRG